MVTLDKVQKGAIKFIENEVTSQMNGWQKLLAETAIGLYMSKLPDKIGSLLSHPMIQDMGIVKDGEIDIDTVYNEAAKHFDSPIVVNIPVIGNFQFVKADLDVLYNYITNA